MPGRGNRKSSLSARLANIQPRGIVPSEEIPGTQAWLCRRELDSLRVPYKAQEAQDSFFTNYSLEERAAYSKLIPCTTALKSNNETLIDNINSWVDGNGWQYIDGGEYDGSWVNPRYPNRIFDGTSCTLPIKGGISETVAFPVASNEEDPFGIACHFEVSIAGTRNSIFPNKWTNYDSTRKGRRWAKYAASAARRQSRWEKYQTVNQIKDPIKRLDATYALKAQFLEEDRLKKNAKMGYNSDDL